MNQQQKQYVLGIVEQFVSANSKFPNNPENAQKMINGYNARFRKNPQLKFTVDTLEDIFTDLVARREITVKAQQGKPQGDVKIMVIEKLKPQPAAPNAADDSARKEQNSKLAARIAAPLTADQYDATLKANPDLAAALEGNFAGVLDPAKVRMVTPERPDKFAGGQAGPAIELARHNHQLQQRRADIADKAARVRNSAAGTESAAESSIMDRKG